MKSTKTEYFIPYARQWIDENDINAVCDVLNSDWLTTGPAVEAFEKECCDFVDSKYAVAVNSGTAALHSTMYALGIKVGDEVIVPAMTFAATANCVVMQGGTPVFVDVDPSTLLLDPTRVEEKITSRTKALISVDYAGQACDYDVLAEICTRRGLTLVSDACHALGGRYKGRPVGSLANLSAFSFHPVKHITTGEGGMIVTDDSDLARCIRLFRNHGISSDHHKRTAAGSWFYEMVDLGYNYRLTDLQCALGLSQLKKLPDWLTRRQTIARFYDEAFSEIKTVQPLALHPDVYHAYHLYVVRLDLDQLKVDRAQIFAELRTRNIGVNVHYIPVYLHPYYRRKFGSGPGVCPVAEAAYERILSLPIFPRMTDAEVERVITSVIEVIKIHAV